MFGKEVVDQKHPAHTFLAYENDGKWRWFENTLGTNNWDHGFESEDDLIADVKEKIISNAIKAQATENDIAKCEIYEYETLAHDCVDGDEFLSRIIEENKQYKYI